MLWTVYSDLQVISIHMYQMNCDLCMNILNVYFVHQIPNASYTNKLVIKRITKHNSFLPALRRESLIVHCRLGQFPSIYKRHASAKSLFWQKSLNLKTLVPKESSTLKYSYSIFYYLKSINLHLDWKIASQLSIWRQTERHIGTYWSHI